MPNDPLVDVHELQRKRAERERHCKARVRFLGCLWHVFCGGELAQRPSAIHTGRVYSVCRRCGDVSWPAAPGVTS